jgi:hypothetical protein
MIPSVMRIETQIPKNKVFKIQVLKTYLTLVFIANSNILTNISKKKKKTCKTHQPTTLGMKNIE